jgi:S1-C subfamily serine protease
MASYPYNDYHLPPRRSPGWISLWPWLVVFASLGFLAWYYWPRGNHPPTAVNLEPREIAPRGKYLPEELHNKEVYEKVKSSVVGINSMLLRRDRLHGDVMEIPRGTGSGFVWAKAGQGKGGFVVTNYHVIQNGEAADVTLEDGTSYHARLWNARPDQDLAVLWIDAPQDKLQPIPVGTSNDLWVGQRVYAIGNPFGVGQSLTIGIISALNRSIESVTGQPISGVIQTDASINPGNSGGPLLDSEGRLIGVNTAIASPSGASAGVGFAIPVDTVNKVVTELVNGKQMARAGIGVRLAPDAAARKQSIKGAWIYEVVPGDTADKAGLQNGDVIVALDDQAIPSREALVKALAGHKVGDKVQITFERDGERHTVDLTLQPI